jgi:hypothetical protein
MDVYYVKADAVFYWSLSHLLSDGDPDEWKLPSRSGQVQPGRSKGRGGLAARRVRASQGCGAACGVGAERRPTVGAPFVRGSWHCRPGQVPGLLETVLGPVIRAYDGRCSLIPTKKQKQKQTNREPVKRRVRAPTASSQIP